jgi:nucleoside-diphosphate-sugar epimerase
MKILLLGSKGQVGQHLYDFLKSKHDVFGLDLVNSNKEDLRLYNNKKFINLIKKSDFVFFLAFDVGGSTYLKNYQKQYSFLMNNLLIMQNVFLQLKKTKKKFIFASSQMSNMTHSSYGILKKIGENLTESLGGISVKFWNVYGIEKDMTKAHVITDFIIKGIKNHEVKMQTNGLESRDFLYADDCCSGLEIIMNNYSKLKKNKTIDLHSGKFFKIKEVAKIISKLFLNKGKLVRFLPSKKQDTIQSNINNKGSKFFFKYWRPKYTLSEGISKVFNYYCK